MIFMIYLFLNIANADSSFNEYDKRHRKDYEKSSLRTYYIIFVFVTGMFCVICFFYYRNNLEDKYDDDFYNENHFKMQVVNNDTTHGYYNHD